MEKPVILMPLTLDLDSVTWIGGKIYFQNVLLSLSALPVDEQPDVYIVQSGEMSSAFIEEQVGLPCLAGVVDERGLPRWLREDVLEAVMPGGTFDLAGMGAIIKRAAASFPFAGRTTDYPRPVYWIPDFQHRHLPHMFTEAQLAERTNRFTQIGAEAGRVLVLSSKDALADFRRFHPDALIEPRVWSFSSALDVTTRPFVDPRPDFGLPKTYFYVPNQFWKHKDFETLIRALGILAKQGEAPTVVVTGTTEDFRHPTHFKDMMALVADLGLADKFRHLGLLPRARQLDVFRAAAAVLQPSLFEGWSTVIEDTKAVGRPLILSDLAVHHEQVPEGGHFFPRGDAQALAALLARLAPALPPGPDPVRERAAAAVARTRLEDRGRALLDILTRPAGPVRRADGGVPRPLVDWAATPAEDGCHCHRAEPQWYAPVLTSAATVEARHWSGDYVTMALDFTKRIQPDSYTRFLEGYMTEGLTRFGADWRFADIVSALLCLSDTLVPKDYLEIGVRQGRSACAVGWRTPTVNMVLCDMWMANYAGMDNPGAEFAVAQLAQVGHRGSIEVVDGDSHVVLPKWLAANPERRFDIITVDGDHTEAGAAADLATVMPRLRLGGALVFDDISHPYHPELRALWRDMVENDAHFSTWSFGDLGYGVGVAIRRA
jgi:glycosyltransferase involved in cell wall biosynthesis/predicted O-methyltransferase YrrM